MDLDWQKIIEIFVDTFALVVMVVSLAGLIVPIFPGIVVIWVMAILSVVVSGGSSGWLLLGFLTMLMILGVLADNFLMGAKAREKGASWQGIGLGLLAGLVGTMIFPPVGGIIAAPLVLFWMENRRLQNRAQAVEIVRALMIGWGWAFVVRFGIGIVMVFAWGIWALFN